MLSYGADILERYQQVANRRELIGDLSVYILSLCKQRRAAWFTMAW